MTTNENASTGARPGAGPGDVSHAGSASGSAPARAVGESATPRVGLVMGSDSDWPTMSAAADVLDEFGIAYEADVVSAHRMAHEMIAYGEQAASREIAAV